MKTEINTPETVDTICMYCGKLKQKGECCPCDIIDPCGHTTKIVEQNKKMPKPMKDVMNR